MNLKKYLRCIFRGKLNNTAPGYSLIEYLVILGLVAIVLTFAFPYAIDSIQSRNIESIADEISSSMFLQQQSAFSGFEDKNHGVEFSSGTYRLYKQLEFGSKEYIIDISIPPNLAIQNIDYGGQSEVEFNAGSFRPQNFGSMELTDGNKIYTIEINSEGLIEFYD